ncbi:hybrid sensor histidine kinase/response regulator [Pseudodesulfovibrio tunisiensis]|uniref:hybrid sensor histidine kinase/response regulator n=1 Tax=Pseudodesulfovibrio tunisiensis TaxID=463192 RepID=UPI001FB49D93|nr:ATP-binding protein [Pseudodesulfovibrio tunisiensis]
MLLLNHKYLGYSVLLADAEEGVLLAFEGHLAAAGYTVLKASSDREALALFQEERPSIVVLDLNIGDMNGADLLRQMKRDRPDTQVIVLADYEEIELAVECLDCGASDYIIKPVVRTALDVCLDRAHERIAIRQNIRKYSENLELMHTTQLTLQQLFDEVPCYISVQSPDKRILRANRRFKEDFGDYIGGYCYQIYKHRTAPCPNCPVEATFRTGKSYQTEEIVTTWNGTRYNVLTWTAPIRDASGDIKQVLEIATDITQIRELQDHLTNLGLMIGSVSHGVKGMLTALDGGMYKLENGVRRGDNARIEEGTNLIKEMVNRIRNTVLDILYYAKERELNWESVNVVDFAHEVANTVEPKAKNSGITLIREIDEALGDFEIDPSVVSSALVNILENAVDACAGDDTKEEHWITYSVMRRNGDIVFRVCDNGMGMDRATREKMFSLFFSSKGSKGTGLGLYIANEVIDQHGGNIKVESREGEGTCFIITLPKSCPWKPGEGKPVSNVRLLENPIPADK